MVVLLVQISVNLSVLKDWGLHPLDKLATLAEVLEQFKRGEVECPLNRLILSTVCSFEQTLHVLIKLKLLITHQECLMMYVSTVGIRKT